MILQLSPQVSYSWSVKMTRIVLRLAMLVTKIVKHELGSAIRETLLILLLNVNVSIKKLIHWKPLLSPILFEASELDIFWHKIGGSSHLCFIIHFLSRIVSLFCILTIHICLNWHTQLSQNTISINTIQDLNILPL